MTVTKFDPFALVGTNLFKDLNRLLDFPAAGPVTSGWTPRVDIAESVEQFVITAELAGVDPEHINVTLDENVLTISGTRTLPEPGGEDGKLRRREIAEGDFDRKIRLNAEVDVDAVSATSTDGILVVTVPKQEAELPRKVTVAVQR